MAMFGWDDAAMARKCTRMAAQKRLAASAAEKMLRGGGVPPLVPPQKSPNNFNALGEQWRPEEDSNLHALQR
jgi:hypothetical protein